MLGLDYLVSPLSSDEFIDTYWGSRPVYIQGDDDKFAGLYGWDTVNDLLFSSRQYAGCRLLHQKQSLPATSFQKLDEWLEKGATLVINNVDIVDPVLAKFQAVLSYELNTRININSYMSYPSKQGFDNHFDFHDVFIVHTQGQKEWVLFEPTRAYPLHRQANQSKGKPPETEPCLKCTLTPGDVLYIPRGYWHYAVAATPSIHLTVGPESRSASEFMLWWAHRLMEDRDDFYRRDFPIVRARSMGGSRSGERYQQHMKEFRSRIIALLDNEQVMDELLTRYCLLSNPLLPEFNLPAAWNQVNDITPDTELVVRQDQKFVVYYDEDKNVASLVMRGAELELAGIPREVLATILQAQGSHTVTAKRIMGQHASLQWDDIRTWLVTLSKAGFLKRAA